MSQQKKKQPPFWGQGLNADDRNICSHVLRGMTKKFKILCACAVQSFEGRSGNWQPLGVGIGCIVKDGDINSSVIYVISPDDSRVLLSEELYAEMKGTYKASGQFHRFQGERKVYGLNFACIDDGVAFKKKLGKLFRRIGATGETGGNIRREPSRTSAPPPPPPSSSRPKPGPPTGMNMSTSSSSSSLSATSTSSKSSKGKKGGRPKIDKSMISGPSNFKHVGHVGLDASGGFDSNNIPPEWEKLLAKAGISKSDLDDEDTRQFVQKFVQDKAGQYGASLQPSAPKSAPPPPPSSSRNRQPGVAKRSGPPPPPPPGGSSGPPKGTPPPPPPSNKPQPAFDKSNPFGGAPGGPPPPPPASKKSAIKKPGPPPPPGPGSKPPPPPSSTSKPGPPPPPPSFSKPGPPPPPAGPISSGAPPPPPPPGPSFGGPPPPPPPSGVPAPPAPSAPSAPKASEPASGRGNLLASIRAGRQLNHVSEESKSISPMAGGQGKDGSEDNGASGLDGLAGALALAMKNRNKGIQGDSSGEESDSWDDSDDDWDSE